MVLFLYNHAWLDEKSYFLGFNTQTSKLALELLSLVKSFASEFKSFNFLGTRLQSSSASRAERGESNPTMKHDAWCMMVGGNGNATILKRITRGLTMWDQSNTTTADELGRLVFLSLSFIYSGWGHPFWTLGSAWPHILMLCLLTPGLALVWQMTSVNFGLIRQFFSTDAFCLFFRSCQTSNWLPYQWLLPSPHWDHTMTYKI